MKRVHLFLFSLIAVVLGFANTASAQTTVGTYSARWSGLPVGTVTLSNNQRAGEYRFSLKLQSGGILGGRAFTTTFSSAGALRGRPLRPYQGKFLDTRRGETRSETISFSGTMPSFSSVPRYIIPEAYRFDTSRARGALDPASALYALVNAASRDACGGSFNIYDGFSLYSASLRDLGSETVRTTHYSGAAKKCSLTIQAIAGKAGVDGSTGIPNMEVSVASVVAGKPAIPVKGALIVNGQRASLRLDQVSVR